jgi:hypothetical protein
VVRPDITVSKYPFGKMTDRELSLMLILYYELLDDLRQRLELHELQAKFVECMRQALISRRSLQVLRNGLKDVGRLQMARTGSTFSGTETFSPTKDGLDFLRGCCRSMEEATALIQKFLSVEKWEVDKDVKVSICDMFSTTLVRRDMLRVGDRFLGASANLAAFDMEAASSRNSVNGVAFLGLSSKVCVITGQAPRMMRCTSSQPHAPCR